MLTNKSNLQIKIIARFEITELQWRYIPLQFPIIGAAKARNYTLKEDADESDQP